MAVLKFVLSHARRHCIIARPPSPPRYLVLLRSPLPSTFPGFQRLLSSSTPDPPDSTPVRIVSYAPKAEEPSDSQEQIPHPPPPPPPIDAGVKAVAASVDAEARSWTREDIRYVKDSPMIFPVSYPTKVAPLPEDRAAEPDEEGGGDDGQLVNERRKIQAATRRVERFHMVEEEDLVPFPTLIKVEKKPKKVIYDLSEAIRLVKANAKARFDETVEAHVRLGLNTRRTDMTVNGSVTLPHGTGKAVRVAVFAEGEAAAEARKAGADIVGGEELVQEIKNSETAPDVDGCFSTKSFMPHLAKIARILRSKMPNARRGGVTDDVAAAVKKARKGFVDFRMDKTAIVHVKLGKVSFSDESLRENIGAFLNGLLLAKPAGLKKTSKLAGYVNSFHICSTMGPGFSVSIESISMTADHYSKLYPQ